MEVFVEGIGRKFVSPDQVVVNIFFSTRTKTYKEAVEKGLNNVNTFNNVVLLGSGLEEKELQTRNFSVNEERVYNDTKRKNETVGYIFNQFATLRIDYDNELLSKILQLSSSLESAPEINFQFGLKDETKYLNELIDEAYNDAKKKAQIMATAAGKTLKEVITLDLNGASNINYRLSESSFDSNILRTMSLSNIDTTSIHPEDIELVTRILSKWNAV